MLMLRVIAIRSLRQLLQVQRKPEGAAEGCERDCADDKKTADRCANRSAVKKELTMLNQ
jgi:hypothetical protein